MKLLLAAVLTLCVAHAAASIFAAKHKNKVEPDVCQDCKNFWNDILKALELAQHQKAASNYACGFLSNLGIKTACEAVLDHYVKQIINDVTKRLDSETICKKMKECPEVSPSLKRMFPFHSNKGNVLKFTPGT